MRKLLLPFVFLCFALFFSASARGITFEVPRIEGFHPLDEEPNAASQINADIPVILTMKIDSLFKDTSVIDFEKRQITFRRTDPLGYTMWEYHFNELSDYLLARRNFVLFKGWYDGAITAKSQEAKQKNQLMKLQWELPVQFPSWAQRVIGSEPPRLSINGSLRLIMGFGRTEHKDSKDDKDPISSPELPFRVEYAFNISGSVGRLISVNIKADNQSEFEVSDIFKDFKIHYKESTPGELEDEIIQEVEIGRTNFQMPGTGLSGYSQSAEGLFGIKVKAKIGPLLLTGIASQERGEAKNKVFSPTSAESEGKINESDFAQNRYFFLDKKYRTHYNKKYGKGSDGKYPAAPKVLELQVWRYQSYGVSLTSDPTMQPDSVRFDSDEQLLKCIKLIPDRHYTLNKEDGYIRFDSVGEISKDQIGIYLRTTDTSFNHGDTGADGKLNLWTIKPKEELDSAAVDLERFHLMWRNVYDLSTGDNLSSLKFAINLVPEGQNSSETHLVTGKRFTEILGISDDKGKPFVGRNDIFKASKSEIIFPPVDTSFFGNEPFGYDSLGEYANKAIYKYSRTKLLRDQSKPFYEMNSIKKSGNTGKLNLDSWGVMPGEIVIADGTVLERDIDYRIDYDMGEIDLISPRAKYANKINVEFQSEAMFVPERKAFLGLHGALQLPFISDKSYMGASVLFQKVSVKENIPQLDQEPYSKALFDINTHIEFEPEWMTKLVNGIPLVSTDAASKVVFDIEVAHSRSNPNTSDRAYIDDFEDSKQSFLLGTSHFSWYKASPPFPDSIIQDSLYRYPPAWDFYWFSPLSIDEKYAEKGRNVWTNTSTVATAGNDDHFSTLRLHCKPAPNDALADRFTNAWAGVMAPLSNFNDRSEDRYFEFLMKPGSAKNGKLIIQMGDLREDVSLNGGPPNRRSDGEDPSGDYLVRIGGDDHLDRGWDTLWDSSEVYLIPGKESSSTWERLGYRDTLLGIDSLDPAKDNYKEYNNENIENRRYASRTQGDGKLSSEDINYDNNVLTTKIESYFQFTIDMDDTTSSSLIDKSAALVKSAGSAPSWRKYRIPLKEILSGTEAVYDTVNNPEWKNISMVRLIWTGFESTKLKQDHELVLADMGFVGSQWLPQYDSVVVDSTGRKTIAAKIEASSIGHKEDDYYKTMLSNSPVNVVFDEKQKDMLPESSLRLKFRNLNAGDTAVVTKNFQHQNIDLSAYDTLNLLVFGRDPVNPESRSTGKPLYDDKVDFVYRFGSDDSTYYEYRKKITSGWQKISIDLKKLATLKDFYMRENPDSAFDRESSVNGAIMRVVAPKMKQPNFTRISWAAIGVIRDSKSGEGSSLSEGELWINDMIVSGISRMNGSAMRASLKTEWADFLSIQSDMQYTDGDFRKMTDTEIKPGNSEVTASLSSTMNLNKFLPQEWGVSVPVGVNTTSSITRPQLKTNSDVFLTDSNSGRSDKLLDMVPDMVSMVRRHDKDTSDMTLSEHYETQTTNTSVFTGFNKSSKSDNALVNLTADRLSGDFKVNMANSEARQGPSIQGPDYLITNSSTTYSGNLKYDLTPTEPLKWRPLENAKQVWIPASLKEYEFSLLPERLSFNLASVTFGKSKSADSKRNLSTNNQNFDLNHSVDLTYSPISPLLKIDYSTSVVRDMDPYYKGRDSILKNLDQIFDWNNQWKDYRMLKGEKSRVQSTGFSLAPKLFDWMPLSLDYQSEYRGSLAKADKDLTDYISASVNNTLSISTSFDLEQIVRKLQTATSGSGLGSFFSLVDSGLRKIDLNSISFSYSATSGLVNNYLDTNNIGSVIEFLKYQTGVKGRTFPSFFTGEMNDFLLGGMRSRYEMDSLNLYHDDSRTVSRKFGINTGISFKVPFDISFNSISINYSKNYAIRPDSTYFDTVIVYPELSVSMRTPAFMELKMFKEMFQSFSVNSNVVYKRTMHNSKTYGKDEVNDFSMGPLIAVNGQFKKRPVTFDYQFKVARGNTKDSTGFSFRKSRSFDHTLDMKYQIENNSRLSEIKLLSWRIPVKGRTTVGLEAGRKKSIEIKNIKNSSDGTVLSSEDRNDKNYRFKPYITYVFTDNITGSADLTFIKDNTFGSSNTKRMFNLIVDIQLR